MRPVLSESLYVESFENKLKENADVRDPLTELVHLTLALDKEGKEMLDTMTSVQIIAFQQAAQAVDMLLNSLFEIQKR